MRLLDVVIKDLGDHPEKWTQEYGMLKRLFRMEGQNEVKTSICLREGGLTSAALQIDSYPVSLGFFDRKKLKKAVGTWLLWFASDIEKKLAE